MEDRVEITKMIAASFHEGAEKAKAGGASDVEIARALIATGLARWGRAVPPEQLVEELARLTAGVALASNVDLSGDEAQSRAPRTVN